MRLSFFVLCFMFFALDISAQQNKFEPQRFQVEFRQYVIKAAALSNSDADAFFPMNDDLQNQKRELRDQIQQINQKKPSDDDESRRMLEETDSLEIKIKELERDYHRKMMDVISPTKLFEIMNAQSQFLRQTLRRVANKEK